MDNISDIDYSLMAIVPLEVSHIDINQLLYRLPMIIDYRLNNISILNLRPQLTNEQISQLGLNNPMYIYIENQLKLVDFPRNQPTGWLIP
jgi:hypothetical protein